MATYTEHYNLKKPDLNDIANIGDINDNMDIIDDEMSKLIDSVPTMSGASASTDGESGVVPQPVAGDNAKYLRGDATYSVPGGMTINGRTPDPVTGDITVIEGGGSGSYGSYRLDATIPVSAWSGSGPYTTTITNEYIKSTMDGSETWLDNEAAMLGETTFTTRDGSLLVSTTVKPTAQWVLHVALALNGADVLADMSASIANVADGLAILATGDTHAQIAKGQFVYVRNHGTANGFSGTAVLADGLYVATAAINANGSLTTSNLAADGAGGLNALKADYDALNSNIGADFSVTAGSSSVTINAQRCEFLKGANNVKYVWIMFTLSEDVGGVLFTNFRNVAVGNSIIPIYKVSAAETAVYSMRISNGTANANGSIPAGQYMAMGLYA